MPEECRMQAFTELPKILHIFEQFWSSEMVGIVLRYLTWEKDYYRVRTEMATLPVNSRINQGLHSNFSRNMF